MESSPKKRLNEPLVAILGKLSGMKTDNHFQNRAYTTAQETILDIQEDITNIEQLRGRPGIGTTIMEKLTEFVNTGKIAKLEQYAANPVSIFSEIYGVGPKKAEELAAQGFKTIADLRKAVKQTPSVLNATQKVGLQYYEDILERIPRREIDEYDGVFEKAISGQAISGSATRYEIVGSYRRLAPDSGDIDVIFTSKDASMFDHFLDTLIRQGVIEVVLSRGKSKCLVIASLPSHRGRRGGFIYRRVDFLFTPPDEYPFAVLYFTGSKGFNVVMRNRALNLGYSMNEHGITIKGTGTKIEQTFTDEQDIFAFLGLEYKKPEERIDGRSVVLLKPPKAALEAALEAPPKPKAQIKQDKPKSPKTKKIRQPMKPRTSKKNVSTKSVSASDLLKLFAESGISVLDGLTESQLSSMIETANDMYYNSSKPLVSDAQYDIVKEYIERKFPANTAIKQVGAQVVKNKVVLPYEMASMDKIKPESDALVRWTAKYKGPYILSAKLDGVSGLYTCEGDVPRLYTRGDGKVGQDVSHLTRVLNLPCIPGLVVRGEFILRKAVFDTKYKGCLLYTSDAADD
jgi:DNA polymerase/3'-5' exonuclease PolX